MRTFIWMFFIVTVVCELARYICLAAVEYPRQISKSSDLMNGLINIGILIWAAVLLFGGEE